MAWPSFHPPAKPPASDLLMDIIDYALARDTPDWDLVAATATVCMGNQCHGHHCDPTMTDPWRYYWVQQAWFLITDPNTQGTSSDAAMCLGEINHGGGGSGGLGPNPPLNPHLRELLRRIAKAYRKAHRRK